MYQFKLPHRDPRDVGGEGLEVVEGAGGVPDDEVDGDEEAAEDDAEAAADDGQEDVLLEEDAVPRPAAAGVRRAAAARSDRNTCNENIFGFKMLCFTRRKLHKMLNVATWIL